MRGLFFLLSILGIVLTINNLKADTVPVFPEVDVFAVAEVEGLTANFLGETAPPAPIEDCHCNGTKKIKSGDGIIDVPCPCGDGCKCKPDVGAVFKSNNLSDEDAKLYQEWFDLGCYTTKTFQEWKDSVKKAVPEPMAEVSLPNPLGKGNQFAKLKKNYIVVYIGASWCGPCHWIKDNAFPELEEKEWDFDGKKFKYTIGEVEDMIIVVDYDEESMDEFCEFMGIQKPGLSLPTFWKIDVQNKKVVKEMVGSVPANEIHKFYSTK